MSKAKKKKDSHEAVEHEHITDDAVQLHESWIEEPKAEQKLETDFEKHSKFSKFKGEK